MSNLVLSQVKSLGTQFGLDSDPKELLTVLKSTAFKGNVISDEQMTALLLVARQYGLNPWCKEIYAFPDKNNGIVPVVGVDGWSRIINENAQFDGLEFAQDADSCTCIIYRKDRQHPIKVTEWLEECKRDTGPWKSHPKRMLRHKALIQCARLAFGYTGIYDQDEAERIVESKEIDAQGNVMPTARASKSKPEYPNAKVTENLPLWQQYIDADKTTAESLIQTIESEYSLSDFQKTQIRNLEAIEQSPAQEAA